MPKTSLLRSLQKFAAEYRLARAWGLPLHAIRAWRAAAPQTTPTHPAEVARRFSRRTFLTRAGIMATALALPRSTHLINMPRIAIVGGGIAGLTCALTLADHGIAATVYEAAGRIGGRMFSNTSSYWDEGEVSGGSSYADTGYQSTWDATRAHPAHSGILTFYAGGTAADVLQTPIAFATAANPRVTADVWTALRQVEPVFPGLSALWNGKATQALPHKSPLFRVSYTYYRVGQYTAFGGYEQVRQGGVLFCGEHTSVDFQGSMEGGAAEGERAARQLIRLIFG